MNSPTTDTRPERRSELALSLAIIELTLVTAYIHLTLGGTLFTLNGLGYIGLAAAIVATALPVALLRRLAWLPRIGLAGYTAATIGAYLVIGPYFTLGWVAKGVEVAILTVVAADLVQRYGSPRGLLRAMALTVRGTSRAGSAA
jgi:hypothetical protein